MIPLVPGFVPLVCSRDSRRHYAKAFFGDDQPGEWSVDTHGELYIRCAACGARQQPTRHTVSRGGEVDASMGCARPGCQFHEFIVLDGWIYQTKAPGVSVVTS